MMQHWPISGLRLTTSMVELRWPFMTDLDDLAETAVEGVHEPGYMPFFSQWTDGMPDVVARRVLQRHWNALGTWTAEDWTLYLVVVKDGKVVGSQSVGARGFAITREAVLTSWLGRRFQGRGIGTHARAATLHLAFEGLGAEQVMVVVRQDNLPSQRVCEKFGFVRDGTQINVVRGEAARSDRYRLDRARWLAHRFVDVDVSGLDGCQALFGITPESARVPAPAPQLVNAALLSGVRYLDESDPDHF
jgi:RimJ/RimL family protein N-acetyltransferase